MLLKKWVEPILFGHMTEGEAGWAVEPNPNQCHKRDSQRPINFGVKITIPISVLNSLYPGWRLRICSNNYVTVFSA